MTLLTIMVAVSAPRLSGFFQGRGLEEETRRIAALTRYARSESIASGERMRLWIAPEQGTYGIEPLGPPRSDAPRTLEYTLHSRLALELPEETVLNEEGEAELVFWPDGNLDAAAPAEFTLLENDVPTRRFVLGANRFEYAAEVVSDVAE